MEKIQEAPEAGYILVWRIKDYQDNGGGIFFDKVNSVEDGIILINKAHKSHGVDFELLHFSWYSCIVEIEPINLVTGFKIRK